MILQKDKDLLSIYRQGKYMQNSKLGDDEMGKFLNETIKYFFENCILKNLESNFISNILTNSEKVTSKIAKVCKIDNNSLILPISEICGIINMSLLVESDLAGEKEQPIFRIHKMSEVIEVGIEEKSLNSNVVQYDDEEVYEFIKSIYKNYTEDIVQKNDNLIITFA